MSQTIKQFAATLKESKNEAFRKRNPQLFGAKLATHSDAGNSGTPAGAKLQKQQAPNTREADNQAREAKVDGDGPNTFGIRLVIRLSDNRERDGDGCESTILDTLMHARERLLSLPDAVLLALFHRAKGDGTKCVD